MVFVRYHSQLTIHDLAIIWQKKWQKWNFNFQLVTWREKSLFLIILTIWVLGLDASSASGWLAETGRVDGEYAVLWFLSLDQVVDQVARSVRHFSGESYPARAVGLLPLHVVALDAGASVAAGRVPTQRQSAPAHVASLHVPGGIRYTYNNEEGCSSQSENAVIIMARNSMYIFYFLFFYSFFIFVSFFILSFILFTYSFFILL